MKFFFLQFSFFLLFPCWLSSQVNGECEQATEVFCGEVITLDFGDTDYNTYEQVGDCNYSTRNESVWYKITGTGDIIYAVTCGNSYTDLRLFQGGCEVLTCSDKPFLFSKIDCSSRSTKLAFKSEVGEEYYIFCAIDRVNSTTRLEIDCVPALSNNDCNSAMPINFDESISYSYLGASPSFEPGTPEYHSLPDIWYSFVGTGGLLLFEKDANHPHSTYPYLYQGACSALTEIDITYVDDQEIAYETIAGEAYLLRLDGRSAEDLTFSMETIELVDNNYCEDAVAFSLGDNLNVTLDGYTTLAEFHCHRPESVWYKFIGDGNLANIEFPTTSHFTGISVVAGDCTVEECVRVTSKGRIHYFPTQLGQTYYINLGIRIPVDNTAEYSFNSYSTVPPSNNDYTTATLLNCEDMLAGTFLNATSDYSINNNNYRSVWYLITGTGDFYRPMTDFTPTNGEGIQVHLYTENNGEFRRYYENVGAYYFLEVGQTYYINLYHFLINSNSTLDDFEISLECQDAIDNNVCEMAIPLDKTQPLSGSNTFSSDSGVGLCTENRGNDVWYSFSGDGQLYDFVFERSDRSFFYKLYSGNCLNLKCETYYVNSTTNGDDFISRIRFFLEENTTYYLQIFSRQGLWGDFSFAFEQQDIAENAYCHSATLLTDGMVVKDSLDFAIAPDETCEYDPYSFYSSSSDSGLWYQITGDDKYYELNFPQVNYADISDRSPIYLMGGDCSNLVCLNDIKETYRRKYVFFAEAGQDYFIFINTEFEGYISFSVNAYAVPTNDDIAQAIEITDNTLYEGYANTTHTSYENIALCENAPTNSDLWFKTIGTGDYLYYDNVNQSFATLREIYTLENETLICAGNFQGSQNRFKTEVGISYYIRVVFDYSFTNFTDFDYDYSVRFEKIAAPVNDECGGAISLNCGDTVDYDVNPATPEENECGSGNFDSNSIWFKIVGDDQWKEIQVTNTVEGPSNDMELWVYEGNCQELACYSNNNIFYAESGKDYYLNLHNRYSYNQGIGTISLNCHEPVSNDLCENASPIACGDQVSHSLNYVNFCDESDDCGYGSGSDGKSVWYEMIGTGELTEIIYETEAYNEHLTEVNVFLANCCVRQPISQVYGTPHHKYFASDLGEKYLIKVSSRAYNDNEDFTLEIKCGAIDDVNLCENAIPLTTTPVTATLANGPDANFDYSTNLVDPLTWLEFKGSGGIDRLTIANPNDHEFRVYFFVGSRNDCQLSPYLRNMVIDSDHTNTLPIEMQTLQDSIYKVAIVSSRLYEPPYEVQVSLRQNVTEWGCKIDLPAQITIEEGNQYPLTFDWGNTNESFEVLVKGPERVNNFYRSNMTSGETAEVYFQNSGHHIVEYRSGSCSGHVIIEVLLPEPDKFSCTSENTPCQYEIQHPDDALESNYYKAATTITSTGKVGMNRSVHYRAEQSITLNAGFTVAKGASFSAQIEEVCGNELIEDIPSLLENDMVETKETKETKALQIKAAPNPFNQTTLIDYYLPEEAIVQATLYNLQGQLVERLIKHKYQVSGYHQFNLDATYLDGGFYFLEIATETESQLIKLVVLK